jgi:hypothetical protein
MKKLCNTDYVIYDNFHNEVCRFAESNKIVIYGNKNEAEMDICPDTNEKAILCTLLPKNFQKELIKQINNTQN